MFDLNEMTLSAELFLSCSIIQLTFYAAGTVYKRQNLFVSAKGRLYNIVFLLVILTFLLIINDNFSALNEIIINEFVINDYLSFLTKSIVCMISASLFFVFRFYHKNEQVSNSFEYILLLIFAIIGLLMLCSANDLIIGYLALELNSVAFYLMAAFKKNSSYSVESGLKYFVIGSLSSAFFLFGSAIVYGTLGTLNLADVQSFVSSLSSNTLEEVVTFELLKCQQAVTVFPIVFRSELVINCAELTKLYLVDTLVEAENLPLHDPILANTQIVFFDENFSFYMNESLNLHLNCFFSESFCCVLSQSNFLFQNLYSYSLLKTTFDNNVLPAIFLGIFVICIAIFIKLALAPFHYWSLDVYEGSPNFSTIFFAVVPKIAVFVFLIRLHVCSFYCIISSESQYLFSSIALLSIFIGSIGGLEERKIKTLLAYSSISHTGYMFLTLSVNLANSIEIVLYYSSIFTFSSLIFWSIYLFVEVRSETRIKKYSKELGDFVLLRRGNPFLAAMLLIILFSIAGVPPFIGFIVKFSVFWIILQSSTYVLAVGSIILSAVSTFYYIRIIKVLYFENKTIGKLCHPIKNVRSLFLTLAHIAIIVISIDPCFLYLFFHKTSLLLLN